MAAPKLRVSPNGLYLVDANNGNAPWMICGDSSWSIVRGCTSSDADTYLDDRVSRGFNSIIISLADHDQSGSGGIVNQQGVRPFLASEDFLRPVPAYFDFAETIIQKAASRSMHVWMIALWDGISGGGEGWYSQKVSQGAKVMRQYGRMMGARFRNYTNLGWLIGGDYNPADKNIDRQLAYGLREAMDPQNRQLMAAHCAPETSAMGNWAEEAWLNVNTTYTYSATNYQKSRTDYQRATRRPYFLIETTFEGEHASTGQQLRRQSWWHFLEGGLGGIYFGNNPIWNFDPGWQTALSSNGSVYHSKIWSFFSGRAWYKLVPDTSHVVVTSGFGTDGTGNYCTTASTPDGSLAVIYVPAGTSPVVDTNQMRGPSLVRWYDPTTGSYSTVFTAAPRGQSLTLTNPGNNAAGDADQVAVLEA